MNLFAVEMYLKCFLLKTDKQLQQYLSIKCFEDTIRKVYSQGILNQGCCIKLKVIDFIYTTISSGIGMWFAREFSVSVKKKFQIMVNFFEIGVCLFFFSTRKNFYPQCDVNSLRSAHVYTLVLLNK